MLEENMNLMENSGSTIESLGSGETAKLADRTVEGEAVSPEMSLV
jgi:hypothetical protein